MNDLDHEELWVNLVTWAAAPALERPLSPKPSGVTDDAHWAELKSATDELRLLQLAP